MDGTRVWLGLGSNLGDRKETLRFAVEEFRAHPTVRLVRVSPLYETEPACAEEEQPRYLNAVLEMETSLDPQTLLEYCLDLERRGGRVRTKEMGSANPGCRHSGLGDLTIKSPDLVVPHPRMTERRFVLAPLADIAPGLIVPAKGRVSDLPAALRRDGPEVELVADVSRPVGL